MAEQQAKTSTIQTRRGGMSHLTGTFLNFRRIWLLSFVLTAGFAIVPVVFFAVIDYKLTYTSLANDAEARADRLASNTWRSVSFFLDERKNALTYVARANALSQLSDPVHLSAVLADLRKSFGGFTDIGIISQDGHQLTYVGPYKLSGKDYQYQEWFERAMAQGSSVSDVFLGYRNVPHISVAIRNKTLDGEVFVVRATIEHQLPEILSQIRTTDRGDAFLVNTRGVLQTRSRIFGNVLEKMPVSLPPRTDETRIISLAAAEGEDLIAAYRYIPDTPFILMVVKSKKALMAPWHQSRVDLIKYLGLSITVILVWIGAVTAYLVRRLQIVDRKRAKYFHLAEYANKMASIGRLAAGVAHEINNPLAIINEKAGLIQDMIQFKQEYKEDQRLKEVLGVILESVARCSRITRQLLSFGRHTHSRIVPLTVKTVLNEVLVFLAREAEHKKIDIRINIPEDLPKVRCDHGKLQQIFLNIINNAFSAMSADGRLSVRANEADGKRVSLTFEDNGCGISKKNMQDIFEPFFSTKTAQGGTGLGLSVTHELVQEMGGRIKVQSRVGQGTIFTVCLPTEPEEKE